MSSAALELLGSLALEDGRRWGSVARDFQVADAQAVLEPGPRQPRMHFLTRARSGSKTVDLAAMMVVALLEQLPPASRSYWAAVDRDQARLGVDAMGGLIVRSGLSHLLRVEGSKVTGSDGATVEVLAADAPSAYGLRPHFVVCDELAQWQDQAMWTALVSALPKVRDSRLVVLTTAGDPAHFSAKVREQARKSRRWRLHEVAGPPPWVSPAALEEQRALLTDSQYQRLHENIWVASENRLVTAENLRAAVVLDGPQDPLPGVRYRMGLDLGLTHDATAVAVAHSEAIPDADPPARRVVLDRLVVFQGRPGHPVQIAEVEKTVVAVWRAYGRPKLRADPFQAAGLVQNLRSRGVSVEEWPYTATRYGQMASVLFALLRDHRLALYDDEALLDELANVRLVETVPGQLRIQHDSGRHDDRCVAMGMAMVPLVERSPGGGRLHVAAGELPPARFIPNREKVPAESAAPRVRREGEQPAWTRIRLGPLRIPPELRRYYTPPSERR